MNLKIAGPGKKNAMKRAYDTIRDLKQRLSDEVAVDARLRRRYAADLDILDAGDSAPCWDEILDAARCKPAPLTTQYRLDTGAGSYESDSILLLVLEVLRHRLWHFTAGDGWVD